MDSRYDISNTNYSDFMSERRKKYKALTLKAEETNMENDGKPTKKEAQYYQEAVRVCEEIISKNLGQRAVKQSWEQQKLMCEAEVKRIINVLAPGRLQNSNAAAQEDVITPDPSSSRAPAAPEKKGGSFNLTGAGNSAKTESNGVTTTPSGFKTKNASKDVPATTIEKWHQLDPPSHDFSALTGMADFTEALRTYLNNIGYSKTASRLGISPISSFFFYGYPGGGKTFAIEAFVAELMKKHNFHYIHMMGADFHASLVGVGEKIVKAAFAEAIDNEPCIIFIDEVENVCVNRSKPNIESYERQLTVAFLEAYNMLKEKKTDKPIIFMGATNYPTLVDSAMMDRIVMIPVPLPSPEARASHFKRKLKVQLGDDLTYEMIADETDNYSYRDMDHLINDNIHPEFMELAKKKAKEKTGEDSAEANDEIAAEIFDSGELCLDWETFCSIKAKFIPSDKTEVRKEMEIFEARTAKQE